MMRDTNNRFEAMSIKAKLGRVKNVSNENEELGVSEHFHPDKPLSQNVLTRTK